MTGRAAEAVPSGAPSNIADNSNLAIRNFLFSKQFYLDELARFDDVGLCRDLDVTIGH
jgi:hypothetical protein